MAGDLVVFATGDGRLVARDRRTGDPRWSAVVNTGRYAVDAPLLVVKDVVIALAGYYTVGVERASGRVLWAYEAPADSLGPFDARPRPGYLADNAAAADSAGTVYVPAWGGSVSAVDARGGEARWVWRLDPAHPYASGATGTAVAGDTVFAALYQFANFTGTERRGWLVSFDRASGRELARVALPFAPTSQGGRIVVTPAAVIVTSGGAGQLAAMDRRSGGIAWAFNPPVGSGGWSYASASGVGGDAEAVFQDGGNDHIYGLHAATGEQLWENDFTGLTQAPTASARRVYASNSLFLSVFDRQDGGVVAKVGQGHGEPGDRAIIGCVTVADREVYVTAGDAAWSFWEP